ncbi:hypothetical protein FRC18_007054 [Serendipita sp. 400]|nr:hypothetical protein FRC18_007054 [Serendipita sp. 400]
MDKSSHLDKTRSLSSGEKGLRAALRKIWGYNAPLSHQRAENCHPFASVLFQDRPSSNFDMDPTSQS